MNKILLIDDNKVTRSIYEEILEGLHIEYATPDNNSDLVNALCKNGVNGIIINENCNTWDCYALFNYLKTNKRSHNIPVIITSQNNQKDRMVHWLSNGAFEYFTRRIDKSYIEKRIQSMLNFGQVYAISDTEEVEKEIERYLDNISSHFFVILNDKCKIIHLNKKAQDFLFLDETENIHEINFFDIVYKEETLRNALVSTLDMLIKMNSPKFEFETSINKSEEDSFNSIIINWGITLIYNEHKKLYRLILIGTDMTTKAQLEEQNQQMAIDVKLKNLELEDINHQLEEQNDVLNELNRKNELLQAIIRLYTPRSTWTRAHISIEKGDIEIPQEEIELTMVFGDIQNFTKFSERHTPTETINSLNELFELITDYVYYFDGDIDKFMGDAFFAIFIDPRNAILAASKINMALDGLNDERMMSGKVPLFVRIGVNTGVVTRGNVGGRERKDNTLIGDAVNIAQRLEGMSIPGQILISEITYQYVEDMVIASEPVELKLKGKKQAIVGYYIEGLKDEYLEFLNINADNLEDSQSNQEDILNYDISMNRDNLDENNDESQ